MVFQWQIIYALFAFEISQLFFTRICLFISRFFCNDAQIFQVSLCIHFIFSTCNHFRFQLITCCIQFNVRNFSFCFSNNICFTFRFSSIFSRSSLFGFCNFRCNCFLCSLRRRSRSTHHS